MAEVVEAVVNAYQHWTPMYSPAEMKQVFHTTMGAMSSLGELDHLRFCSVGPMSEFAGITDAAEITRFKAT